MGKILKFYTVLGNNSKERFTRFLLLVITIGLITMFILNLGYDKKNKGGCYWKPADVSIKKGSGNIENEK